MNHGRKNPLVSVIIPTHNRAWIVEKAILSVLEQDYNPFELIVVDDGSTDHTMEIVKPFMDRLTLIRQKNQGVSAARNSGIKKSKGELIAFLDSDDLWLPGKLSCQVDFFSHNPDAMICQTQEIWIRNGKRVNPKTKHKKRGGMIFDASLHLCLVSPSAVMMRRSLFDLKGLFDETLPACEDYDLWLRIGSSHPIHLIDTPLIQKRGGHPDQLSKNHSLDKYRIQSIQNLITGKSLTPQQQLAAEAVFYEKCNIYGQGCLKRGKVREGHYYLALKI